MKKIDRAVEIIRGGGVMEAVKDCKCGQKPIAFGTNYYFFLYCQNCFEHSEVKDNPAEAIAAWNRRTQNIGKRECCAQGEEQ